MEKKTISIGIPKPCAENWDDMTETEQGKFCASCQKEVIDFSHLTNKELFAELEKLNFKSACGRFSNYQLGPEIKKENVPSSGFSGYKAAAAIFAGTLAIVPTALQAQDNSQIVSKVGEEEEQVKGRQIVLKGRVVGENGKPIKKANISIDDTISTEADTTGYFEIAYSGQAQKIELLIVNEHRSVHKIFSVSLLECADGHSCIADLVFELPISGWRKELNPSEGYREITTGFFIVD